MVTARDLASALQLAGELATLPEGETLRFEVTGGTVTGLAHLVTGAFEATAERAGIADPAGMRAFALDRMAQLRDWYLLVAEIDEAGQEVNADGR